jgi:hypothetical protein
MGKIKSLAFVMFLLVSSCGAAPTSTPGQTASPYPTQVKTVTLAEEIGVLASTATPEPSATTTSTAAPSPTPMPADLSDWSIQMPLFDILTKALGVDPDGSDVVGIDDAAFNPDHSLLAVGGCINESRAGCNTGITNQAPFLFLFDTLTRQVSASIPIKKSTIFDLAFTPDGQKLVIAGRPFVIKIWDVATGHMERTIDLAQPDTIYPFFAISPDGKSLALSDSNDLRIIDFLSGKVIKEVPSGWGPPFFSADGSRLLMAGPHASYSLAIYDTSSWKTTCQVDFSEQPNYGLSPDGTQFFSLVFDGQDDIQIWDADTCKEQSVITDLSDTWGAAYSPDGSHLYIGGTEAETNRGGLILWDVQKKTNIDTLFTDDQVRQLVFSPDGERLVAYSTGTAGMWGPIPPEQTKQREMVVQFYDALAAGDYPRTADIFKVEESTVALWNLKGVDASDSAGVLAAACKSGILICLPVKELFPGGGEMYTDTSIYMLELADADGSAYQFSYGTDTMLMLIRHEDGTYSALSLPINE